MNGLFGKGWSWSEQCGRQRHLASVSAILALSASVFMLWKMADNAFQLDTWLDEGNYLAKGWWYINGDLDPYSATEPTLYTPLFFYILGALQVLFGEGYLAGRMFSVLCGLAVIFLTVDLTKRITGSFVAAASAAILMAGQYLVPIYYATATPYAVVSLLSLIAVRLLASPTLDRRLVWLLNGLLLCVLVFIRPNMMVFALVPALWLMFFEEPRRWPQYAAIAAAAFLLPSAALIWTFGHGLLEALLRTPGLATLADSLGLFRSDFWRAVELTESPFDPQGQWRDIGRTIHLYLVQEYALLVVAVAIAVGHRLAVARRLKRFKPAPLDVLILYVIVATVLHLVLSQSYCVPCITPYAMYFLPFAAIVGASLVAALARLDRRWPSAGTSGLAVVAVAAIATQILHADSKLLRSEPGYPSTQTVRVLAEALDPLLPDGVRATVLSTRPIVAQAVWLAGGVVEPLTMNLAISYREFRASIDEPAGGTDLLRRSGFWNAELLSRILREEGEVVVVSREQPLPMPLDRVPHSRGLPFGEAIRDTYDLSGDISMDGLEISVFTRINPLPPSPVKD